MAGPEWTEDGNSFLLIPGQVGATYRMLEKAVVRLGPDLKSQEVFKARICLHDLGRALVRQVSSSSLVLVKDINNVEIPGGWQGSEYFRLP